MAKGLQSYHRVWLSCHPGRTEQWLRERMADGFHVHHADGDHTNDAPNNLILLEGLDHMLIVHGHKVAGIFTSDRAREMGKKRHAMMDDKQKKRLARKAGIASGKARRRNARVKAKRDGALLAATASAPCPHAQAAATVKG